MLSHLGFVIAFAIKALLVTFAPPRKLIVIQIDSQSGFVGNSDRAIRNRNPPAGHDFVLCGLPRIMRVTSIGEVRGNGGCMRHCHQGDSKV